MGWILCRDSIPPLYTATGAKFSLVETADSISLVDTASGATYEFLKLRRPPLPKGMSPENFSPRERTVFKMLGDVKGTRAIAEALGVSSKTVETYVSRVKQKLDVKTAQELCAIAVEWRTHERERTASAG